MTAQASYDLLQEPIIRIETPTGPTRETLPGLFARYVRDEVVSTLAVQAHQRHAWHATMVQIAAIVLRAAGTTEIPDREDAWRELLAAAVPEGAHDTAWCLVAPFCQPAFLQTPVEDSFGAKKNGKPGWENSSDAPTDIDILVTSKNHDLKIGQGAGAEPDDWMAALVSVQTQSGFDGRSNYGVVRMNGGLGSRTGAGLVPPGGPGAWFVRDLRGMSGHRSEMLKSYCFKADGGIALTWLDPWDGKTSLNLSDLDPFFVETARRYRLVREPGGIRVVLGNSDKPRVAGDQQKGDVGDPWTVVSTDKDGRKAFTNDATGLPYGKVVGLLFGTKSRQTNNWTPSPFSRRLPHDPVEGMRFSIRSFVRGQGKTEGYHERLLPIAGKLALALGTPRQPAFERLAEGMIQVAGEVGNKTLGGALMLLASRGDGIDYQKKSDVARKDLFLPRYSQRVDAIFFERYADLCERIESERTVSDILPVWATELHGLASEVLEEAIRTAPLTTIRRHRAGATARNFFTASFRKNFPDAAEILLRKRAPDSASLTPGEPADMEAIDNA